MVNDKLVTCNDVFPVLLMLTSLGVLPGTYPHSLAMYLCGEV